MSKCKDCKSELMPDFRFCPYCGKEVIKTKTAVKLPKASQLPSGAWRCQIMMDGKRMSIVRDSKREAIAEAIALRDGIIAVRNKPSNRKLTDAIDDYIGSRSNILSPSTIRGYRIIQRRWDKQSPNITLGELTDDYLQRHYNDLAASISSKTLSNDLAFISSILAAIAVKPSIRLPQRTETKRGYLTPTEIQTLCKACIGSKNEIPTLLGLSSLRISEICALRWDNIDMERRTITVSGARLYDEHNRLIAKSTTKNATSRRTIPIMSEQLYDALSAVEDKSGYVVSVRPNTISRRLRADCIRAGVREVSPHELRHSFASLAASLGVPERIAMAIGGWANDKIMKETYTHLYREDIANSENALADFFNNRETKKKS